MSEEVPEINYKELEPVDPEGPGAGPAEDYEVVADYPTEPFPEEPSNE